VNNFTTLEPLHVTCGFHIVFERASVHAATMTSFVLPLDLAGDDARDPSELRNRIREMVLAQLNNLDLGRTSRQLSPQ